ncbi:Dolichyl-diphosphooligosaccharide-protein glycosyltransferase 48 kDa subunit [Zancudomyces culisetae]|uniref:Dolichyl-diphosphooligosaccharide--protein glycosyltransferase subunit WBP1 n=1 Tax=Zancudomyces culisetae TaxID=1213189 RepID=A0A1R1PLN9_ZANCU|nr:Dolichyl-diphosphooligosaccharide-protein glycosyltransferase 48 kDa subunit [Zancudomyces culisetae]|eukprot:OMH81857.1 Dolichyl-diphosphooligosaccharide-protein glycosyltransferase 48 kDa subunit [Zancudomyces culisetae]
MLLLMLASSFASEDQNSQQAAVSSENSKSKEEVANNKVGTSAATKKSLSLLIILPDVHLYTEYSGIIEYLFDQHGDVDIKPYDMEDIELVKHGEKLYDNVLILCPKCKKYGDKLKVQSFIDYVNIGGNLILAADNRISKFNRKLAHQFGVEFQNSGDKVIDFVENAQSSPIDSSKGNDNKDIFYSSNFINNKYILPSANTNSASKKKLNPVLYGNGIGHIYRSMDKKEEDSVNPLLIPILSGSKSSFLLSENNYSRHGENQVLRGDSLSTAAGSNIHLVSAFQAKNNARVAFFGSLDMFSDKYFSHKIDGKTSVGNKEFTREVTDWVFQKSGVVKVVSSNHHLTSDPSGKRPEHYRVGDQVTYSILLSELKNKTWVPFELPIDSKSEKSDQVQLQIIMLDPYIRKNLVRSPEISPSLSKSAANYSISVKLPQKYGVFKFNVDYRRPGLTFIDDLDVIAFHPLRHDEFPRFLSQAYPYYLSFILLAVGFLLITFIFLVGKSTSATPTKAGTKDKQLKSPPASSSSLSKASAVSSSNDKSDSQVKKRN